MFVLICSTLLLSIRDSSAQTGASLERREFCKGDFCITLIDGEITAEAGLCVMIPCSFTVRSGFYPQSLVWLKCEPDNRRCDDSDAIFSTNSQTIQPGFKGRVSLLEPNVFRRNCSIIINDLTASDSGSYQLRVNLFTFSGSTQRTDQFQYQQRTTVLVKDLTQKPTVTVPPLTEGLQTTLSCTAPGLCSGSAPEITWMWRGGGRGGRGEDDSHITENITDFKSVAQRHSSTLSFTPSAKHHGTNITCKVRFKKKIPTEETVTLSVTYVKEVNISGNTSVREDQHSLIPWVVVAAVSLSVNVVLVISLMFLCNKRKIVKPNQEDRTYMSLKKRDQSAEYDVIDKHLN